MRLTLSGMTKRVRCAVIGAGWWGTTAHIPALLRHPGADLCCVHHRDRQVAQRIARDFAVPCAAASVEEALDREPLDAVVISSTPNVHYAQATAALQRGLHVLIEKPMTITAAEAGELVSLADRQGVHFLLSGPWHYTAHAATAQRLVRSGALGDIKMISVLMTNFCIGIYRGLPWEQVFAGSDNFESQPPYLPPEPASFADPAVSGGGQIYTQVAHVGAYLAFLTGADPRAVFARFDNYDTEVDVYDSINATWSGGTLVSIASTGAPMPGERTFEVRVFGTEAMLFLELWHGTMRMYGASGAPHDYAPLAEEEIYPLHAPAENLVDVVAGVAPNRSPATLGWSAMKLIEAACESARSGADVRVA
ncbi:MAG: Gfo/Idh/MocA family oxidoreductase [Deltaproteobacteria bacterium]|nr:Gfo/Idh/MocA family oxidoreductase [Deltaproteobacteria bacterium]